jgi:hypothetical protein
MATNTRLENELKVLHINYEAVRNELDAFKNALHDIRIEATQTSGRVRQRYFKPNNGGTAKPKAKKSSRKKAAVSAR